MSFTGDKVLTLPFLHADQTDKPNPNYPSTLAFKQALDSSTQALQTAHNALIDDLMNSTASTSGSEQIGSALITGVIGSTVYTQLSYIESQVQDLVGGVTPPGTITTAMIQDEAVTFTKLEKLLKTSSVGGLMNSYFTMGGF